MCKWAIKIQADLLKGNYWLAVPAPVIKAQIAKVL